jgi:hypothetical protein
MQGCPRDPIACKRVPPRTRVSPVLHTVITRPKGRVKLLTIIYTTLPPFRGGNTRVRDGTRNGTYLKLYYNL